MLVLDNHLASTCLRGSWVKAKPTFIIIYAPVKVDPWGVLQAYSRVCLTFTGDSYNSNSFQHHSDINFNNIGLLGGNYDSESQ